MQEQPENFHTTCLVETRLIICDTLCWGEQMLAWITGCLTDDKVVLSTDIQVLKYMPRGAAGRQASVRKIAIS